MLLAPAIHVAVGLGLLYVGVARLINRTVVEITDSEISIKHGPLPWRGNDVIPRASIERVSCREVTRSFRPRTRRGRPILPPRQGYEVAVITKSGESVRVVAGLTDPHQGVALERMIETKLGIRDSDGDAAKSADKQ